MSEELKKLMRLRYGYRDNSVGELSPERNAIKILKHEIGELENTHMIDEASDALKCNKNLSSVVTAVKKRFGKDAYALWLGTKKGIEENYGKNVVKYYIPPDALPLSDLADAGILFVSKFEFQKCWWY